MSRKDLIHGLLLKLRWIWNKYDQYIAYIAWVVSIVCVIIWTRLGTDVPLELLAWSAPVVGSILLIAIFDTHKKISGLYPADSMDKDECRKRIVEHLNQIQKYKLTKSKPITIDVIGLALSHSCHWIDEELRDFLNANQDAEVDIRLVFVDPDRIKNLGFLAERGQPNWEKQINERIKWVYDHLAQMKQDFGNRFGVYVRLIDNIPHWHGVMIERRILFIGRISWSNPKLFMGRISFSDGNDRRCEAPTQLTCARNGYREYQLNDPYGGGDRIRLFRKWLSHYCYAENSGHTILDLSISNPVVDP